MRFCPKMLVKLLAITAFAEKFVLCFISFEFFFQLLVRIPPRPLILLCEEAIQLGYGTLMVLLRCLLMSDIMHRGSSSTSKAGRLTYYLYQCWCDLNPNITNKTISLVRICRIIGCQSSVFYNAFKWDILRNHWAKFDETLQKFCLNEVSNDQDFSVVHHPGLLQTCIWVKGKVNSKNENFKNLLFKEYKTNSLGIW